MQADTSVSGQWHPDGAEFGEWCHTYHWASMPASSGRSISAEEGSHSFQLLSHVAVWMHEGHEMVNGVKGCYRLPCLRPQCSARDLHLPGAQFTKNLMNDVFHKFSQVCYKLIIRQPLMNSYDYNKIELDYRAKHSKLSSVSVLVLIANCSLATLNSCICSSPWTRAPVHSVSSSMQSHNFQLPDRTSALRDKNFIMRMLYSDYLHWQFYFSSRYSLCNSIFSVILFKFEWS